MSGASERAARFHIAHEEDVLVTFVSPAELRASVPPEPPWEFGGYIAPGNLTILAGKPKAGKSTLGLAIADAISNTATSFLGHAVTTAPVVYVSEEGAGTLAHKAGTGDIRFATRDTAWPRPDWRTLITAAIAEAKRVKAAVLTIDTFAAWAGLGPESEKDAGTIQYAIEPLIEATRDGLAVLLVVHTRKGGGEDGEGIRGSSALAGAADIILELERVQGGPPRQRKLLALSRYPQTPGVLVIEHDPATGTWSAIGEATDRGDAREITDRAGLIAALDADEPQTRQELEEAMGSPERQWHVTIERLIETGYVVKTGAGKKGDPYRYKKLRTIPAQASAQDRRSNGFDNAAHPVGVQHQNHAVAETFVSPRCAASDSGAESDNGTTIDACPPDKASRHPDTLPSDAPDGSHGSHPNNDGGFGAFVNGSQTPIVTHRETAENPDKHWDVTHVTHREPENGGGNTNGVDPATDRGIEAEDICDRHPGHEWRLESGAGWVCGVCHPPIEGLEVEWKVAP